MPKRKSCFDELPILSKMHIGAKEVDLGVNFEKNMSKVFERTHALLFNGKANGSHSLPNGNIQRKNEASSVNDSSCQTSKVPEKNDAAIPMNSCCLSQQKFPCSFCEKAVCLTCCRMCHNCRIPFCQLCSILQYSSQEETALCLSCL